MSPSNLITNWLLSTYITILKPIMQKEASTFMYVSILSYASSDFVAKKHNIKFLSFQSWRFDFCDTWIVEVPTKMLMS